MKQLFNKIDFEKIYYGLSLLLAFAAPLSWKVSRVIMVLIIVMRFIQPDYKSFFEKIKTSKFLIVLLLFLSYQLLSMLWSQTSYAQSHAYFEGYLLWFAIPIIALSLKQEYVRHVITAFLLAMAISEFTAYGMYFSFWTIHGHGAEYPSPFMHHTAYSIFMAFTAMILLNRLYSTLYTLKEKLIMGIFFLTVSGNLFISQGRSGQLAFAVAILVAGILHFKLRLKTLFLSILVIGTLFTFAYQFSPMFQKRVALGIQDVEKIQQGNLSSSWGIRVAYIILGTDIIKDNPLIGVGLEDASASAKKYLDHDIYRFPAYFKQLLPTMHFHNQYLMTTIQTGFIGLMLFFILFYYFFKLPIKDEELKRLSILFATIFLVGFTTDVYMTSGDTRTLFILFIALFTAASLDNNNTKESS